MAPLVSRAILEFVLWTNVLPVFCVSVSREDITLW